MSRRVPTRTGGGALAAANLLDELRAADEALTRCETEAAKARAKVQALVVEAYEKRVGPAQMARVLGVSRQRVWQIISSNRTKGAA